MDLLSKITTSPTLINTTTATEAPDTDSTPTYVGFICCIVAVIVYGSNFVPVKKYETGDGIFFQWILCSGIFLTGLVLQMVHTSHMYIFPMAGGAIWAVGNLCVVPVIKTIGMGLGLSIWGTCALCIGWAIGRFGLFGTKQAVISHYIMNDISVVLAVISIFILLMVKNEVSATTNYEIIIEEDEEQSLLSTDHTINDRISEIQSTNMPSTEDAEDVLIFKSKKDKANGEKVEKSEDENEPMFWEKLPELQKRIVGSGLSVFSGLMYGVNFTPTEYIQNKTSGASQSGLDYVFAQFCGIYLASTVFMLIYCMYKRNRPKIYPQVIVPGFISGIMWAVATACWNIANSTLSQAVSFPIVATGPCGLASLFWGVLIFGEIKGCKNISVLTVGFVVNLTGAVLAGLSK